MHVGTGNLRANQPVAFRVANEEQLCFFPYIYKEIKGNSSKYTKFTRQFSSFSFRYFQLPISSGDGWFRVNKT